MNSSSSVSGGVLYEEDCFTILQRQTIVSMSQNVFSNSKLAPKHVGQIPAVLHAQEADRRVRERVMGLARRHVW